MPENGNVLSEGHGRTGMNRENPLHKEVNPAF
jgi:hypothetical protein